ncbi:glutamate receptor 3.2, partial [Trifolium medium]|nr:glutamate receptor 3.2 [Trifolium medium]
MEQAVIDVNSNSSILHSTQLVLHMQTSNCSGFDGMIQGEPVFDSWSEQFLAKLYLPCGRTLDFRPTPPGTQGVELDSTTNSKMVLESLQDPLDHLLS